jgi:hypothetical protein
MAAMSVIPFAGPATATGGQLNAIDLQQVAAAYEVADSLVTATLLTDNS